MKMSTSSTCEQQTAPSESSAKPVPKPRRCPPKTTASLSKPPTANLNPPRSTSIQPPSVIVVTTSRKKTSVQKNVIMPPRNVGVASRFSVPTPICNPKCNSFPPSNKPVKLDTGIARRSLDTGLDKQQKAGAKVVVKESSDFSGTKRPTTASSPNSGDTSNSKVRSCNIEKTDVKIHAPDDLSSQQLMDLGVIQQNYADSSVYNQVPRGDQEHNNNTNYLNVDPYNRKQKSSSSASGISITYSPPTYTDAASRDTNIRSGITLLEQLIKSHPIWYLQHLGRAAANHLLRPMQTGVFLVRASSRSTSDSQTTDAKKSKRSSKTTTMALSVRLPRECSTDIDHYLIETASSDAHSIRLEGSPHTFSSLPLLLQHYCYNGEELQTKLSLPWAISSCQSIQGLQALALMGQDFWTSEVSRMPPCPSASTTTSPVQHNTRQLPMVMHNPMMSPRRAGSSANSSNCSTSPVGKPAQQQPLKMSRSVSSTGSGTDQMFRKAQASKVASIFHRGTSAAGWLNHAPSKEKQPYPSEKIKIKKPRASSTIRLSSSNSSDMTSSSAKVEPVKVAGQEQSTPTWYAANTTTRGGKDGQASPAFSESSTASTKRSQLQQQRHGLLKKSQSAYEDLRAKSVQQASQQDPSRHLPLNINVGRRSGSVKTVSSNGSSSFGQHGGGNFLRNLFSSSNQSTSTLQQQENHSSSLAQCDYFLPYVSNNAAGCKSQSEAMIWASFSPSSASQVSDNDRISTNYLFNGPSIQKSDSKQTESSSDKSTRRKGFARLKSTFKMPFSAGAHPPTKSKDDSDHHSLSSEVVLARQLAFRRTNTDLCAESVHRLVGYHSIGDSPPPTTSQKPQLRRGNADAQHQAIAVLHRHHRIHQKVAPVQQSLKPPSSFLPPTSGGERKGSKISHSKPRRSNSQMGERSAAPLIPPDGRQQMDDSAMRKCIDELRRKRMQTATASSTPANNTSAETLNESKLQDLYPNKSNQIILRSQPDQLLVPMTKRDALQERFSVPNMPDRPLIADCDGKDQERDELMQKSRSVADSVRALTAKMGGNSRNNTGELQTINEGLMTPVVRRKKFPTANGNNLVISPESPENSVQTTTTLVLHLGSSPEDKSQDKQNSKLLQHQQPEKEVNMASKPAGDTDFSAIASISEQEETSTSTCHAFHNPNCNTRNHREVAVVGASELEEEQVTAIIKPALGPLNNSSRASKIAVATVRPQQHNNRPAAMESEDLQHQHIVCDIVVDKPGGRCSTTSVNNQQRSPTEEPPPKRQSEYAQLSELVQYFEDSSCSDPFKMKSSTLEVPCNIDEDAVSIAGTDFNEPWDSNAWDNLLDLARFGDEKPSTANAIRTLHSTDTIVEEDDLNTSAISADEEIQEGDHHHNPHHQHQTDVVVLRPRNGSSTCSMDKSNNNDGNNVEAGGRKFKLLALNNYGYESESLADEEEEEQDEFEAFTNDIEASTSGSYDKDTAAKSDRLLSSKEAAAMAAVLASSGSCSGDGNVNWPFKAPTFGIAAWMKPREDGNSMKVPLVEQEDFKNGVVRSRHRGGSQQHRSSNTNHKTSSSSLQRNRMASQQNNNNNQPGQFNPLHGSLTDLRVPSLSPVISPARLRNLHHNHSQDSSNTSDPSCILQKYVEYLAADESTMFGSTLHRFIECTIESEETDPSVVIRRVRQFLNGMKNYLVKNGELDLHGIIERESEKLNANEFLNIDAIFEAVLNKILLVPIKAHLYHLMVRENTRNGELQRLSENLSFIRAMEPQELGFSPHTAMPDQITMEHIRALLRKMQHHYSPLKKLDNLLRALSMVVVNKIDQNGNGGSTRSTPVPPARLGSNNSMLKHNGAVHLGVVKHPPVEELIRWLVYLLAKCSAINCEIEAWYMWELLPQQLLTTGDAAYYLSTLFSAVQVLKNPDSIRRLKNISAEMNIMGSLTTLQEGSETEPCDSFLRIAVPNEQEGSIEYHTFPVLPQMNVAKLCRVISHQFAITNPEDYGLYILFDGFETYLLPKEYPHVIRDQLSEAGKSHLFAYKRNEARIAWPKNAVSCCTPTEGLQPRST